MLKIAVASGKGGTGKTFVATNLFSTLIHNNYRVTLVDCDAEAPDAAIFFNLVLTAANPVYQMVPEINTGICTYCGKCREYCNYNAIFILPHVRIINVIEDLCHGCGACSVACKPGAITERPVTQGQVSSYITKSGNVLIEARTKIGVLSPVPVIRAAIKNIDNDPDIVIFDSPPGTSCPFIQTVFAADFVILVTEPTPFGLSDLKQSVESLNIIGKPFGVIINRAGIGNNGVQEYIRNENIELLLEIPYRKETAGLYSMGRLVAEEDPSFRGKMLSVFEKIFAYNGVSGYKR